MDKGSRPEHIHGSVAETPITTAERFLRVLHEPGDVFEERLLGCPAWITNGKPGKLTTWSGHYRDPAVAAADVVKLDASHKPIGCYVTVNPVRPDLLARGPLAPKDVTTQDTDIERRRWLPVDLDPERPAKIAATEEERAAALALAEHIRAELTESGWPAPVCVSSGNGALLLYRIDLHNDPGSTGLLDRVLEGMALRFNTSTVHVDRAMYNASRIIRLPGTWNRKGTDFRGDGDIPARPHRLAELLEVPAELLPVSREQLEAVAAKQPPIPGKTMPTAPRTPATSDKQFERFEHTPMA